MEIICSKCSHVMPHAQAAGYLFGEALTIYKKQMEVSLAAQKSITRSSFIDSCSQALAHLMVGLINNLGVKCPKCQQTTSWTTQEVQIATATPSLVSTQETQS